MSDTIHDPNDPQIKAAFDKYRASGIKSDLVSAISSLNKYYGARLSHKEMDALCAALTLDDFKQAEGGHIEEFVHKIRTNCHDDRNRDNFSFATKLAYFASNGNSPIFDRYVEMAIKHRGYTGERDFKSFFEFMSALSKQENKNFRELDTLLFNEGKAFENTD